VLPNVRLTFRLQHCIVRSRSMLLAWTLQTLQIHDAPFDFFAGRCDGTRGANAKFATGGRFGVSCGGLQGKCDVSLAFTNRGDGDSSRLSSMTVSPMPRGTMLLADVVEKNESCRRSL